MTVKKRIEMSQKELNKWTLFLKCAACGLAYSLLPVCSDGNNAWYSSDREFCPECGSGEVARDVRR